MINLSESVGSAVSFEINHKTAAQVVLDLYHMACHDTSGPLNHAFGHRRNLFGIIDPILAGRLNHIESVGFCWLSLELNREDHILHRLEQLSQTSHVHINLALKVLGAVHGLEKLFAHLHGVAMLVADSYEISDV